MAVYQRGRIWWCEFQHSGQRVRTSTRQTSKRKAQEFERRLRTELKDGANIPAAEKTYEAAVLRWLDTGAPESMMSHIRNTVPYLADTPLSQVPDRCVDMVADMRQRGLSNQTINRRLAVVKRVLNLAFKEWSGWLDYPLAQKISKLSEKGSEREVFLTKTEVMALVGAMKNEAAKRVTLVAAYTGMRKSEILNLRPSQWQPPYVTLDTKTKSGKRRTVPIIAELHEHMQLPFGVTRHQLRIDFEQARAATGIDHVRFHDLRHTFASWLVMDPDVPLTVIRDLLGHSSLTVTSRYTHLRGNHLSLVEGSLGKKTG